MDPDPDAAIVLEQVRGLLGDLGAERGRPIGLDTDLVADLDLDSLALVELLDRVERALSVTVDDAVLGSARTVREWIDALSLARGAAGGLAAGPERNDPQRDDPERNDPERNDPERNDRERGDRLPTGVGDLDPVQPTPIPDDRFGAGTSDRPPRGPGDLAYGVYVSVVAAAVSLPLVLALYLPVSLESRWRFVRGGVRALRWAARVPVSVEGDLRSGPGGRVLVSNHGSFLDGFVVILASPGPLCFVTSVELDRVPVVGGFLRRLGCVFVSRDSAERASDAVSQLLEPLLRGRSLLVFPEGGLDRAPGVRPFRLGAFNVAVAVGTPVVPVGIDGTRAMLPPGAHLARRGSVRIRVGGRIEPVGAGFSSQVALRDRARAAIEELVRTGDP